MSGRLEVTPAGKADRSVLENLMELYIYDFSEFVALDVGEDGRFRYPGLSIYWQQPGHQAFLARMGGKLAGFALIRRLPKSPATGGVWDMAEFFILRRYRRQGAGTQFAAALWNKSPGDWQVRVRGDNAGGLRFWQTAIGGFSGRPAVWREFIAEGVGWRQFRFQSPV